MRFSSRRVFAHSGLDLIFVLLTIVQLGLVGFGLAQFTRVSILGLILYSTIQIALTLTQYHVVIHNFIHTRFFTFPLLNSLYAVFCSVAVLSPFTDQALEHLNHHKYVNDRVDRDTNTTRDSASTFRYGKGGKPEPLWRYALLSPLRQALEYSDYSGRRRKVRMQVFMEIAVTLFFWATVAIFNWKFLILSLAIVYTAQIMSSAQNYLEHFESDPENRLSNSVSGYGKFYNIIWFNNGYHQEHHLRPNVHWTKIKDLRAEMLSEHHRRVAKIAHFPIKWEFGSLKRGCRQSAQ